MGKQNTKTAGNEYRRVDGRVLWVRESQEAGPLPVLGTPADVARYMMPIYAGSLRESLYVLGLDAKNRGVCCALVGAGTADRAPAHAREVFAPLLVCGALKGVLVHNHPSGDPTPSAADIRMTRVFVDGGKLLGVPIVDHVVIGDGAWVSLREQGMLSFD